MATQVFVPNFRIQECLDEIKICLERGWTGLGFKTVEFEKAWQSYSGLPHAHFLNSNTSGLHLAINLFKKKHGWAEGDEIITTPMTFVSSNHAILYERMTPIFADVDQYLCLAPESVEKRITNRTRAVLFVGIGGNTGEYEKVLEICRKNKLIMILDAAHMAGTRYKGKHIGADADCTVFSFQAVKNLPTADSGMICFRDAEDDAQVRKLSWLGINKDTFERTASQGAYKWMYDVEEVGFKYHGNSIMAAIGLVQLKYLDADNSYRRTLCKWYTDELAHCEGLNIVPVHADCDSSRHLFQIRVSNRDELMLALNQNEIYPGVHYRDNTEYRMYSDQRGKCPESARASAEVISLPLHMRVTFNDVKKIASVVKEYLRK